MVPIWQVLGLILLILVISSVVNRFILNRGFYVGKIVCSTDEEGKQLISLELDEDPAAIPHMRRVIFKVEAQTEDSHQ